MPRLFWTVLFSALASGLFAQYRHFDNFEFQIGFRSYKVEPGLLSFGHDTLSPDSSGIAGQNPLNVPGIPLVLSVGYEFEIKNDFFASAKADFNLTSVVGRGIQIGAGYRYDLNYFMRIQPEIMVSWNRVTDSIGKGKTGYYPGAPRLGGKRFWDSLPITAMYRNEQFGIQPKITFVAEFADRFEFRYTMMYTLGLVNNQAILLRGLVAPNQPDEVLLPFRSEHTRVFVDDKIPTKAIYRSGGFSARVGLAVKLFAR